MSYSPITLGRCIRSFESEHFILTETVHPPLLKLESHHHERPNISFVLRGSFSERVQRETKECTRSSVLFKNAGETHSDIYGKDGAHCLIVEFRPEWKTATRALTQTPVHLRDPKTFGLALKLYRELIQADSVSDLSMQGILLELLSQITRQEKANDSCFPLWLKGVHEVVTENFAKAITLRELASLASVHPGHLTRAFRRYYRCSLGEYIRKLRLQYAARELRDTDTPITEIALRAGYYDQSHFTHAFRKYTGKTPGAYRNSG